MSRITAEKIHPLTGEPMRRPEKPRVDLGGFGDQLNGRFRRKINATYDAARDSDDFRNYWANADSYDADSANSRAVRAKLVPRSRYEVGNNGYADGIAQTYATDLVGVGPNLRMQTGSTGFNKMVETEWYLWCKAVKLRRKLWCQAHAKHQDGEGLGVSRTNLNVNHPVKLDYVLYETEQFQTPMLSELTEVGYIDGIKFDAWGNPEYYDLLVRHPGASSFIGGQFAGFDLVPERIPARFVMHWFLLRRPGQHRGVPECSSTLNVGASSRRWREATVASAETAADFSVFLETQYQPDELDAVTPLTTLDIQKRMMTALPNSVKPFQMTSQHPNATYDSFNKSQINELARPKSMPFNKAACDSSSYNYASGRLDHQTYYGALDVDREDGNDLVLDPLFNVWFDEAIIVFGWLGGSPSALGPSARSHSWDWPKHPVADIKSEADANKTKLSTGQTTLSRVYSESGLDFEEELIVMANDYGCSVEEMRQTLRIAIFNSANQQASMEQAEAMQTQANAKANEAPTQKSTANG